MESKSKNLNSKKLAKFLFQESQDRDEQESLAQEVARLMEDAFNLSKFEDRRSDLIKILKDLSVEKADDRLRVCPAGFELVADDECAHSCDQAILLDFEKSEPLVSAGFVAIPSEVNKDDKGICTYAILIVPENCCDSDDMDKLEEIDMDKYIKAASDDMNVPEDDKSKSSETAEELVKRILKNEE